MESEIGKLMSSNNIKIKQTNITKLLNREILTMMKDNKLSVSDITSAIPRSALPYSAINSKTSQSKTFINEPSPGIEEMEAQQVDFSINEATIGEARIDL